MQPAIGYVRVSTKEQGRSGLGLAAQRHDIEVFGEREGFAIKSWHQDVQTGAGADALDAPGACTSAKRGKVRAMPSDRLEAGSTVAQCAFHHRAYGA